MKDKIRALVCRTSQQNLRDVQARLGLIMRGWASYIKYAVRKQGLLQTHRPDVVARDQVADAVAPLEVEGRPPLVHHPAENLKPITADGIVLFHIAAVPVTR